MRTYIISTDNDGLWVFELPGCITETKSNLESFRDGKGRLHSIERGVEILFRATGEPKKVTLDDETMRAISKYNLEQDRLGLCEEISKLENHITELHRQSDELKNRINRAQEIAKDILDGKVYVSEDELDDMDDD
jgi:hypothetical protein